MVGEILEQPLAEGEGNLSLERVHDHDLVDRIGELDRVLVSVFDAQDPSARLRKLESIHPAEPLVEDELGRPALNPPVEADRRGVRGSRSLDKAMNFAGTVVIDHVIAVNCKPSCNAARPAASQFSNAVGERRPIGPREFQIEAPAGQPQIRVVRGKFTTMAVNGCSDGVCIADRRLLHGRCHGCSRCG